MATVNLSTAARNAAGASVTNLLNAGSLNPVGFMEIRTGSRPANPQAVATGTLLATLPLSNPAFGSWTAGSAIANTISPDTNVDNTGIAGWFRMYDRDGVAVLDGTITQTGGGGNLEFDNVSFVAGGTVQIVSLTATIPG